MNKFKVLLATCVILLLGTFAFATLPTLSINDVSVTEPNTGVVYLNFTVTLSARSASVVTVHWATTNNTAASPDDYTAASGDLSFPIGTLTRGIAIQVKGDTTTETNETLYVDLSNPFGATISDGRGVGTITDNDATPTPTVTATRTFTPTITNTPTATATATPTPMTTIITVRDSGGTGDCTITIRNGLVIETTCTHT
jgi:hypothetical protein